MYSFKGRVKSDIDWGFLGFKKTRALTEFRLEKDEFFFGETINIRIIYDGSNCVKDAIQIRFIIRGMF